MHTPASALCVVLEGSSQCCGKLLWKLQEGFLESGVPEIKGKIVEGQVREVEEGRADRGSHGEQGRSVSL